MNLDDIALPLNRQELKSDSPIAGVWWSREAAGTDLSYLIVKFLLNGKKRQGKIVV